MSTYSELLKDPRWQKKRLEILNRDEFTCSECCNDKMTLHVHHSYYECGLMPWEYPDSSLVTLCEKCHDQEESFKKYDKDIFRQLLASGLTRWDLMLLSSFLQFYFKEPSKSVALGCMINYLLEDIEQVKLFYQHHKEIWKELYG